MLEEQHILLVILTTAAVTFTMRALPFLLLKRNGYGRYVSYIGERMPLGIMTILAVYSINHEDYWQYPWGAPVVAASLTTIILYLVKKSVLAAIFGGIATYLIIANFVFPGGP